MSVLARLLPVVFLCVFLGSPVQAQDPEDLLLRGAEWEARGDMAHAAESYARALAIDPGNAFILCRLGLLELRARRPAEAQARFAAVLEADPNNILARSMHGFLLLREGKAEHAREDFEAALAQAPSAPLPCLGMAALLLAQGKEEEALDRFAAARPGAGDDPEILTVWRDMARGLGLPVNARLAQDGLVELAPRDPSALNELGWSLLAVGQAELARNAWTQSLRLNPGDMAARSALAASLRTAAEAAAASGEDKRAERLRRDAEETERGRALRQ